MLMKLYQVTVTIVDLKLAKRIFVNCFLKEILIDIFCFITLTGIDMKLVLILFPCKLKSTHK